MKRLLFTLAGLISFAGLFAQCSVIEMPLVQRVNASSLIVEGRVTEQYSYWNSTHTMIYTANKIELYKIFKGSVSTDAIEIITEGGTVDMDRITVEPNLELEVGQEGMFTCVAVTRVKNNITSRNALPQFEAYASLQGFVKYDPQTNTASDPFRRYSDIQTEVYNVCSPAGHHQYVEVKQRPQYSTDRQQEQFMAGPDPQSFSPTNLNAGTGDVLEIFGEGFGASRGTGGVRFPNADDGGATFITPHASQYIVWQDDYIKLEVPQNAGTGIFEVRDGLGNTAPAPSSLTIFYAHLNVDFDPGSGTIAYQTDHVDDNGSGGYTWRMNTAFDANAPARASFMRAFDTWRCATLVNWSIGATTSINDAVSDGTNIICFDNTAPLSANILGVCYSYWSGCASGPNIVWYVNELDIIFDEGSNISPLTWEFGPAAPSGSEYDFETVAVHELGHGHQLGHIISPGSIMHYAISNGTSNRVLDGTDVAGGQFVQGKSVISNLCGPGAMSNTSCGSPPVADFNAISTTICAGTQAVFSDLSTGAPTQWLWSFTGGSPSSSTSQNPIITYNTPGVYDVSLTATNANGSDGETRTGYITVVANPTVGFTSNPGVLTVCQGDMVTLSGTGASTYNWNGPISVTNGVPFACTQGGAYSVSGIDANGCFGSATATITMNASPTITVTRNPSNGIVCSGNQATLTASGAQSYSWTGGVTNAVPFTPPSTATYTVTGTAANGCTATAQSTITVQNCSSTTRLTNAYCAATNLVMTQWLYNIPVTNAQDYQYLCTDIATSAQYSRVKNNNQPNMPLGWISGLQYGHSYYVQVRAKVNNVWGAYGPLAQCSISMASTPPPTSILPGSCGAVGLTNLSYLYGQGVSGSTGYWWQVTGPSFNQGRYTTTPQIRLNQFSGLQTNTTYTVTLKHYSGGMWSAVSAPCTFTTGGTLRLIDPNASQDELTEDFSFSMSMYPNPLMNGVNPSIVINGADQKDAFVNVLDLTGRVVASYKVFVEGDNYTTELAEFPDLVAGMYIMQVQIGDQVQNQKFIAE